MEGRSRSGKGQSDSESEKGGTPVCITVRCIAAIKVAGTVLNNKKKKKKKERCTPRSEVLA